MSQTSMDLTLDLAVEVLNLKKQSIVFVNTRKSTEKTAETIASSLKTPTSQHLLEISESVKSVLSSPTKQCNRLANCIQKGIAFHHSGLAHKQRELVEDGFRDKNIKIICSTSTLAYGLDLPAFRVILRDLKRFSNHGLQYIPVLEYLQMCGRAGRPKFDDVGEAIAVAVNKDSKEEIKELFVKGVPEEIHSKLAVEPVLRTYVLSLIASDMICDSSGFSSRNSLLSFFSKTFWAHHYGDMGQLEKIIDRMLFLLQDFGFIKLGDGFASANIRGEIQISATILGERVSELYIDPLTANAFISAFKFSDKVNLCDFSFLQMISDTLELRPLLRVKRADEGLIDSLLVQFDDSLLVDCHKSMVDNPDFLSSIKTSAFFFDWINEFDEGFLLKKFDILPGEVAMKLNRADWLIYTCIELCKVSGFKHLLKEFFKLRVRLKYGAKEELLPLLKLKGVGRVRARKMFNNTIKDLSHVKSVSFDTLSHLIGVNIAVSVKKQVGQDFSMMKVKKGTRKGQLSLMKFS